MNYYYLSGVSHIHHFRQIQKKMPGVIAVSLSNDVARYFVGEQCFRPLLNETQLALKKIPISVLDESVKNFAASALIGSYIFNERLIDLNGIYYATSLAKLGIKTISYCDNVEITKFYKLAKIRHLNAWMWFSWFKNFFRYKFLPIKWYEAHDGIYLGVSKMCLVKSGIGIVGYPDQYGWNPFSMSQSSFENKSGKIGFKIVIALGYSVFDGSNFFDHNQRELIYRKIIKSIPNVFVKYHPKSSIKNEFQGIQELSRNEIIEAYYDDISVLISDYSLSLINMSQMGIKTISILDMLAVTNQEKYSFWREYLSSSGANIFFPKNIDELIEICKRGSNE